MKYREMLNILLEATNDELAQDMSVYCKGSDEFHSVVGHQVSDEQKHCPADGILDEGHLYLEIEA